MIPNECKRLAEVDFPIAEVSKHAAREKSIRHGHPSTLHLWWARRPLAACRSMLLALLLPDPADPACPQEFREAAASLLSKLSSRISGVQIHELPPQHEADSSRAKVGSELLRDGLLKFIGEFANWDLSSDRVSLEVARGLVKAAYAEEPPVVLDPFAGGGSIPLEALRLECDAIASDLNPLACLINKVMLESIPRHGRELAENLDELILRIRNSAEQALSAVYPRDPNGARPVAYIWARTVRCEQPRCGAEIPIFKSPWLSKKGGKRAKYFSESPTGRCVALIIEDAPRGGPLSFRIARGDGSETPRPGFIALKATKAAGNNSNVICHCCGSALNGERVMAQLTAQRGGAESEINEDGERVGGAFLLAVVTAKDGVAGKAFRLATTADYSAVRRAALLEAGFGERLPIGKLNPTRPSPNARGLTAPTRYGVAQFSDLFTARQRLTLRKFAALINDAFSQGDFDDRMVLPCVLAFGRCVDQSSAQVRWIANIEAIASSFPRQALQMTWDFVESVPVGVQSANFGAASEWVRKVCDQQSQSVTCVGQSHQEDARHLSLPDASVSVGFTDPPYYDAVPYADLSDFFLSWLKPAFSESALRNYRFDAEDGLSPKADECTWNRAHKVNGIAKSPAFFESCMGAAFTEFRRTLMPTGIGCVVFAHKTTEGWEALLNGLLKAGWVIRASWPIVTERGVRTNAQNTASLASSIHLVCRPRPENAGVGDWGDVLRELPGRVQDWMDRLQDEGVRGADLVFACIGPALEIYSRYSKVVDAEEREIPLGGDPTSRDPHQRGYLAYVWEIVGRSALERVLGTAESKARNGGAGALEEDARLTALFLWTLQSTAVESTSVMTEADDDEGGAESDDEEEEGTSSDSSKGFSLVFDVVRRFAQPLGIHLEEWEDRIIRTKKGVVRLIPVLDRGTQLFGEDGASLAADRIEAAPSGPVQLNLFPSAAEAAPQPVRGRRRRGNNAPSDQSLQTQRGATTLDRVHAAMLLQHSGRSNALRALLRDEVERGPDFVRLANALSALYPASSDEKRLVDAMLLAVPR